MNLTSSSQQKLAHEVKRHACDGMKVAEVQEMHVQAFDAACPVETDTIETTLPG